MGTSYLTLRIWTYFPNAISQNHLEPPTFSKPPEKLPYHPLLHLPILKKVLNFSKTSDLLKIRLVCKTWNSESCQHLKRRLHYHKIENDTSALKLLKLSQKSLFFPLDSFSIRIPRMNKTLLELFNYQKMITSLKITVSSNDFPILLTSILKLRSLKTLTVCRIPEESIESVFLTRDFAVPSSTISTFRFSQLRILESVCFKNANPKKRFLCNYTSCIVSFLKSAYNINHLEFYYWSTPLTKIFRLIRLPKLNSLVVEGRTLGHMDVSLLSMKKFSSNLKNIEICVDKNVKQDSVQELIDSFADTIKKYKIT